MKRELKSLRECLDRLRLKAISDNMDIIIDELKDISFDFEKFLVRLLKAEIDRRDTNIHNRRLSQAKFPYVKTINSFDFKNLPNLNTDKIYELRQNTYIKNQENIIFIGGIGTGKTHLSIDIGLQACQKYYTVRFYTATQLTNELLEAASYNKVNEKISFLSKVDLLIIDSFATVPFPKAAADYLYQIIESRCEKKSTMLTTNVHFDKWIDSFGYEYPITAILDRLLHKCQIIEMQGKSYNIKEQLNKIKI